MTRMEDYPTTNKEELNRWTALLEALLLRIAEAAQKYQKQYYFGGGIAIDLNFGGFTRPHADLDFYPREEDTAWWQEWFRSQGYIVSTDRDMEPLLNAFSVINESNDYFADVYPIAVGTNGEISMAVYEGTESVWDGMLIIQGDRAVWEGKSWNEVRSVTYKGQTVYIENYKTVLMQKEEYLKLHPGEAPSEKHLHDFQRAGIGNFDKDGNKLGVFSL